MPSCLRSSTNRPKTAVWWSTSASVVAGEMIASLAGIGHEITYHSEIMEPGRMFAWILLAIALTVMVNALLSTWTRTERSA